MKEKEKKKTSDRISHWEQWYMHWRNAKSWHDVSEETTKMRSLPGTTRLGYIARQLLACCFKGKNPLNLTKPHHSILLNCEPSFYFNWAEEVLTYSPLSQQQRELNRLLDACVLNIVIVTVGLGICVKIRSRCESWMNQMFAKKAFV